MLTRLDRDESQNFFRARELNFLKSSIENVT